MSKVASKDSKSAKSRNRDALYVVQVEEDER